MAVLDPWALTVLQYLDNEWQTLDLRRAPWPRPDALQGPGGHRNLACWNWALSGFRPICVDPTRMFAYCSQGEDPRINCLPALGNAWYQSAPNMLRLDQIQTRFLDAVITSDVCRQELINLSIEANGLTLGGNGDYRLAVYSKLNNPTPTFDHWWLEIAGVTIEMFPNLPDVRLYTGGYAGGHALAGLAVDRIDLVGIHQEHKDLIQSILRNRRDSVVLRHPGGRQAWRADNARAGCVHCNVQFSTFTRRHHCRCCGDIFCNAHSSQTRFVTEPATRPNTPQLARSADRVRVCVRCCPIPP